MPETPDELRDERNHWIGEAKKYENLYLLRDDDALRYWRQRNHERARVASLEEAIEAVLLDYDAERATGIRNGRDPNLEELGYRYDHAKEAIDANPA